MEYICNFCGNNFKYKRNLDNHIKTSKKCIKSRNIKDVKEITTFNCNFCLKNYTKKQSLKTHQKKCVHKIEHDFKVKFEKQQEEYESKISICNNKIEELESKIKEGEVKLQDAEEIFEEKLEKRESYYEEKLEKQKLEYEEKIGKLQNDIKDLATKAIEQPTTTNNNNTTNTTNNILNLAPLDMEELMKKMELMITNNMTEEHVMNGQAGVAKLISSCFTTDDGKKLITCTDTSRGVWKSKDKDGNIIKDYRANNLAKVVKPLAISQADKIIEIDDNRTKNTKRINKLTKLIKQYIEINERDEGLLLGIRKDDKRYKYVIDKMTERDAKVDDMNAEIEKIKESGLYDKSLLIDSDKFYKLYDGKSDIDKLGENSTRFSNTLIPLV